MLCDPLTPAQVENDLYEAELSVDDFIYWTQFTRE